MEEKTNPEVKEEKILTQEEIKEAQQKTINFYNRQIEVIIPQVEYARLSAELEEHRLKQMVAQFRQAEIVYGSQQEGPIAPSPPPDGPEGPGDPENRPVRKLKTETAE